MRKQLSILIILLVCPLYIVAQSKLFEKSETYLSKHDIVYLDPDYNGFNGFPLGNGDMGGMLWLSNNGLELQINKIDLYDIPKNGNMTLRSAGRVHIDFGMPCFDYLDLKDFEARLSLKDALSTITSSTPFSNLKIESWVDKKSNLWILDCYMDSNNSTFSYSPSVSMERWGSRDFGGWYGGYSKNVAEGLGNAKAKISNKDIIVQDSFEGGLTFCMACRVIDTDNEPSLMSDKKGIIRTKMDTKKHFQIMISIATSNESANPLSAATKILNDAEEIKTDQLKQEHLDWWHSFWQKSFVHIGDDYLENIYYLRRYIMASSSSGRYLSPFNGGLWTWNKDIRQWVTPHHWNTQESYWGLAQENDCDLMKPYINTYFRLMPQAEAYAGSRGIKNAILWTEAHDFSGKMISAQWNNMVNNFTPASQIASIFWDYYQYTDSKECLQDTVYPFMKKAAEFYLQYLKWDSNKNQFYIFPSQPYEHEYNSGLKNCITDRYMIESLFNHCISAARILKTDNNKIKAWKHVIDHLWEPPVLDVPGVGEVFGLAYRKDDSLYPMPEEYSKYQFYHFDAHTTAVFPADIIGLDQKGTRYFSIAQRIAMRHPAYVNAITPGPIVSARLGLADKSLEHLKNMVSYLQHFNQGLFYNLDHWYGLSRYANKIDSAKLIAQRDYIFDIRTKYNTPNAGRSGLWAYPYVQCGMETLGIFGATVNEMLMQCQEGKIRVFPATPANWESAFTLLARGAFIVSACKDSNNNIHGVEITSLHGNKCSIQNPWEGKGVVITQNGKPVKYKEDKQQVITFNTIKNTTYSIQQAGRTEQTKMSFTSTTNQRPKHLSEATLGKERTFNKQ